MLTVQETTTQLTIRDRLWTWNVGIVYVIYAMAPIVGGVLFNQFCLNV
jgi:hypothetical protein